MTDLISNTCQSNKIKYNVIDNVQFFLSMFTNACTIGAGIVWIIYYLTEWNLNIQSM